MLLLLGYARYFTRYLSIRPRPQSGQLSVLTRAMDAQTSKALADRHHFQRVDIDMRRQVSDPPYRFGHIFRC